MKKFLLISTLLLAIGLFITVRCWRGERTERIRQQNNATALMNENRVWQTRDGEWAATVQALELTRRELEKYCGERAATIKAQGVKIKRLESVTVAAARTELELRTALEKVTVLPINHDQEINTAVHAADTIKQFHWSDGHVTISGTLHGDNIECRVESIDSLLQYVYREPRRFLFIKWGTKELNQTIISSNPHTKIIYQKHIKLIKK